MKFIFMPRGPGPILLSARVLEATYVYVSNKSDFIILPYSSCSVYHIIILCPLFSLPSSNYCRKLPICPLFQLRIRHKIYPLYYYHTSKANMRFPILSVAAVLVLHSQMRQGLGSVQTAVINIPRHL
jgi:hypothetical protein